MVNECCILPYRLHESHDTIKIDQFTFHANKENVTVKCSIYNFCRIYNKSTESYIIENRVDPDQTPRSAASDLSLPCFLGLYNLHTTSQSYELC